MCIWRGYLFRDMHIQRFQHFLADGRTPFGPSDTAHCAKIWQCGQRQCQGRCYIRKKHGHKGGEGILLILIEGQLEQQLYTCLQPDNCRLKTIALQTSMSLSLGWQEAQSPKATNPAKKSRSSVHHTACVVLQSIRESGLGLGLIAFST